MASRDSSNNGPMNMKNEDGKRQPIDCRVERHTELLIGLSYLGTGNWIVTAPNRLKSLKSRTAAVFALKVLITVAMCYVQLRNHIHSLLTVKNIFDAVFALIVLSIDLQTLTAAIYALHWNATGALNRLITDIRGSASPLRGKHATHLVMGLMPVIIGTLLTIVIKTWLLTTRLDALFTNNTWASFDRNTQLPLLIPSLVHEYITSFIWPFAILPLPCITVMLLVKLKLLNSQLMENRIEFEEAETRYSEISHVVGNLNNEFSSWIGLMLMSIVCYVACSMFSIGVMMKDPTALFYMVVGGSVTQVIAYFNMMWPAALIHEEQLKIVESIRKLATKKLQKPGSSDKNLSYLKLINFMQSYSTEPLGITVANLATIYRSLVLNYMSVIITYVLLLVQFYQTDA